MMSLLVGLGVATAPRRAKHRPENLGYGSNQTLGYRDAIDAGFDFVILLRGDGQCDPGMIPQFSEQYHRTGADVVLGSRMHSLHAAAQGGMPVYKMVGNRPLTWFQNAVTGRRLSEYHTGDRGYSTAFLSRVPVEINTNGFHFDTESLLQAFYAVLTTPNVAFLGVRLNLLLGRFSYRERGILDIPHKRLFTKRTLLSTLDECGYDVTTVQGVGVPFEVGSAGASVAFSALPQRLSSPLDHALRLPVLGRLPSAARREATVTKHAEVARLICGSGSDGTKLAGCTHRGISE